MPKWCTGQRADPVPTSAHTCTHRLARASTPVTSAPSLGPPARGPAVTGRARHLPAGKTFSLLGVESQASGPLNMLFKSVSQIIQPRHQPKGHTLLSLSSGVGEGRRQGREEINWSWSVRQGLCKPGLPGKRGRGHLLSPSVLYLSRSPKDLTHVFTGRVASRFSQSLETAVCPPLSPPLLPPY